MNSRWLKRLVFEEEGVSTTGKGDILWSSTLEKKRNPKFLHREKFFFVTRALMLYLRFWGFLSNNLRWPGFKTRILYGLKGKRSFFLFWRSFYLNHSLKIYFDVKENNVSNDVKLLLNAFFLSHFLWYVPLKGSLISGCWFWIKRKKISSKQAGKIILTINTAVLFNKQGTSFMTRKAGNLVAWEDFRGWGDKLVILENFPSNLEWITVPVDSQG